MKINFKKSTATNLAVFAKIIYAIFEKKSHKVPAPSGYSLSKTFEGVVGFRILGSKKREVIAAAFQKTGAKDYIITFRGTDSTGDKEDDGDVFQSKFYNNKRHHVSDVYVHGGFYDIYNDKIESLPSLRTQLWNWLEEVKFENISTLYITGHSLGSALSTLFTYDLFSTGGIQCPVIHYNFAAPMVGNKSFCSDYSKYITREYPDRPMLEAIRIVNTRDLVPKVPGDLPFEQYNYLHVDNAFNVSFCWKKYEDKKALGSKGNIFNLLKALWKYLSRQGEQELTDELVRVLICHSMINYQFVCNHLDENNHYSGDFEWEESGHKYTVKSK